MQSLFQRDGLGFGLKAYAQQVARGLFHLGSVEPGLQPTLTSVSDLDWPTAIISLGIGCVAPRIDSGTPRYLDFVQRDHRQTTGFARFQVQ